jgi:hypothetical protein
MPQKHKHYHLICDIDETLVQYKWGHKPRSYVNAIRSVLEAPGVGSLPTTGPAAVPPTAWYGLPAAEMAKYDTLGPFVLRPGLRELLAFAFAEFASVSILTRATLEYAQELQRRLLSAGIIPRRFDNVWARAASNKSTTYKRKNHSKNLEYVWRVLDKSGTMNRRNTVFIDDLEENTHNPSNDGNSILLPPFSPFGYEYEPHTYKPMYADHTLHTLIGKLRRILSGTTLLPFSEPQRITRKTRRRAKVPA